MSFFSVFKRLMPTRDAHDGVQMVADLDRMISKPIGIRLFGMVHIIRPMNLETYLSTVNQIARIDSLRKKDHVDREEIRDAYGRVFAACCSSIRKEHVEKMNDAQIAAFFGQVMEQVQGKAGVQLNEKKKH